MHSCQDSSDSHKHEDAKMNMLVLLDDCHKDLSKVELLRVQNLLLFSSISPMHDGVSWMHDWSHTA